jgi:hypothetical protein
MCKSRIGVRLGKVPIVQKPLFSRRCNFSRWLSAANCQAGKQELIAYFPLIRHGPHRKRRFQQFFVAASTSLQSCYLAMMGDTQTGPQTHASTIYSTAACIHWRGNVFTEPLPGNNRKDTHTDTQTDGRDLWNIQLRCHGAVIYVHTMFRKEGSRNSKVNGGKGKSQTHRQTAWRSRKDTSQ